MATAPARSGPKTLVVTMGEPAGIGGEVALMAWEALHRDPACCFFLLDDPDRLKALAHRIGRDVPIEAIDHPEMATEVFSRALPVVLQPLAAEVVPGKLDPQNAQAVLDAISSAVFLVMSGKASAMVTAPIHKDLLYAAGFKHPGHTEYLAELGGVPGGGVMMLVGGELRVVPATVHLALKDVAASITPALLERTARTTLAALQVDFGLARPRLAMTGLNPHAGEGGSLGREEQEIIAPVIKSLQAQGHNVTGPHAADALFRAGARDRFDAALCMYHDQALVPLKALAFDEGVNVTLGLPFVRTSPDHGTALDLAGKGTAQPSSMISAIRLASEIANRRALNG